MHLSIEVFSKDPEEMFKQAQGFIKKFKYPQMSIKVQVGWNELETIKRLSDMGISVNCTACMTVSQAMLAARAGAKYVSLFSGRIRDGATDALAVKERTLALEKKIIDQKDFNPVFVVESVRKLLDESKLKSEIIVGSIRSVTDIRDLALAGAHIITIPPKFFPDMASHFKTDQVVEQFLNDFKGWLS